MKNNKPIIFNAVVSVLAGNFERLPERWCQLPGLTKLKIEICNPAPYLRAQGERFRRQAAERNRWFDIRLK